MSSPMQSRPVGGTLTRILAGGFLLAVLPLAARAQQATIEPLATDRPDFVESSLTVGLRRFQIEFGPGSERQGSGAFRVQQFAAPFLLRYGVSESVELRLETDGYVSSKLGVAPAIVTTSGLSDAAVGLKWHAADGAEGTLAPSVAWLLHADLPVGSPAFRGRGVRPSLRAVGEWAVPGVFSLGVMPGIVYESTDLGERYVSGILAATIGHEWTDRFHTFIEVSGQALQAARYGGNVVTYDAGGGYFIGPDFKLDAAVSFGATPAAPDLAFTLGMSRRFR